MDNNEEWISDGELLFAAFMGLLMIVWFVLAILAMFVV